MLEHLFRSESAHTRHRAGPFAEERVRYLQHCADHGATRAAMRVKANELLWLCQHLRCDASQGIDIRTLQEIARENGKLGGRPKGTGKKHLAKQKTAKKGGK